MKQSHNQISDMPLHPIFKQNYTAEDLTPNALIQQLKSFRAKSVSLDKIP